MCPVDAIIDRMKELTGEKTDLGLSLSLGKSKGAAKTWRARDTIPIREIMKLAEAHNASLDWILTGNGQMRRGTDWERVGALSALKEAGGTYGDEFAQVPRLNVDASAGPGAVVDAEDVRYMMAFRRDWIRQELRVPPERLRIISARGDSMDSGRGLESDIHDGDLLLVDHSIERVDGDAVYVIRFDGLVIVKRIQCLVDGGVRIMSANEAYAPQEVSASGIAGIDIVGRVVYVISGRRV